MKFTVFLVLSWLVGLESFKFLKGHSDKKLPGLNVVIDLSRKNMIVNLAKAKEDGIEGVLHKATHGVKWKDPMYDMRRREAECLGLFWGAYHFGTEKAGFLQANHFLKTIGDKSSDILLALKLEDMKKGPEISVKEAEDFVETVRRSTGRYPLVYGSNHLAEIMKGRNTTLFSCPLWIAQYGPRAFIPRNTWVNWTLWQYTDGNEGPDPHIVEGIGRCDRDSINNQLFDTVKKLWLNAGKL